MGGLTYRIDRKARVVTITGDYADAEAWQALLEAIGKDAAFGTGFSFVRDLRHASRPVSPQTVLQIIHVVRKFWKKFGVHRAAIVTGRPLNIPASVAQALGETAKLPLRAFEYYDDALRWLQQK